MRGSLTIQRTIVEPNLMAVHDVLQANYTTYPQFHEDLRELIFQAFAEFLYYRYSRTLGNLQPMEYLVEEYLAGALLREYNKSDVIAMVGQQFDHATRKVGGYLQSMIDQLGWSGETLEEVSITPTLDRNLLMIVIEMSQVVCEEMEMPVEASAGDVRIATTAEACVGAVTTPLHTPTVRRQLQTLKAVMAQAIDTGRQAVDNSWGNIPAEYEQWAANG